MEKDMGVGFFNIQMVVFIMGNGLKMTYLVMENCIIQPKNLLISGNGKMGNLMEMGWFLMILLKCFKKISILKILTIWEIFGHNMLVLLKMI